MASATIHDLSWNTKEFAKNGNFSVRRGRNSETKYELPSSINLFTTVECEANSSLSSTYYSINRTAGAQLLLYFKEWDFPGS